MGAFIPDKCPFVNGIDSCKLTECSKNIMGMCTKKGSKNYPDVPKRTNFERIKLMSVEELAQFLSKICPNIAIKLNGEYVTNELPYILNYLEREVEE